MKMRASAVLLLLLLVLVILGVSDAGRTRRRRRRFIDPVARHARANRYDSQTADTNSACGQWACDVRYFSVPLDHFAYTQTKTFSMRYFVNAQWYKPGGPIFFYPGNEGGLEGFAQNTGIVWDLAPLFNAAVVFTEHRFYGQTQPFGNQSYSSVANVGYLTSEQALADYAVFLTSFTASNGYNISSDARIIAFGGSYGAMLAAWFRSKYPHIAVGAWASSAPMLYLKGGNTPVGAFDAITTQTFQQAGCNIPIVQTFWNTTLRLAQNQSGLDLINSAFNVDKRYPITADNAWDLIYYVQEGIEYMAMTDYPYPSNFLENMPGWPVNVACSYLNFNTTPSDADFMRAMYLASSVYYGANSTTCATDACGDEGTAALGDDLGWPWQECTELDMEMCTPGPPNDMFFNTCPVGTQTLTQQMQDSCVGSFKDIGYTADFLRETAATIEYGLNYRDVSNIIFTSGALDPWSSAGVTANTSGSENFARNGIYPLLIQGSAHHLDLRTPNTCDPPSISNARYQIVNILWCWAYPNDSKSCPAPSTFSALPPATGQPTTNCSDIVNGYPWGQGKSVRDGTHSKSAAATASLSTAAAMLTTIGAMMLGR